MKRKIGVFDSGIGGLSVADTIERNMPEVEVVYANDQEHVPYGDRTPQELLGLVLPILQRLVDEKCAVIVVACNTVTTTIIDELRARLPVPLIGLEPMVKTAAETTKTGVVAVCATPATLASKRYAWLKDHYAAGLVVLEPDCSQWARMIEHNQVNDGLIKQQIEDVCARDADVIVLGCTHYHWIENEIKTLVDGRAAVIQPEQAVLRQLKRVLARLS